MALSAELPRLEQIAAAREPEPERTAELYGMRSHCLPMRLRIATQLADSPRPDPHPPGFRVRVGSLLGGTAVSRALAKSPQERFASAGELAEAARAALLEQKQSPS
jgi:hypothetical protein